MPYKLNISEKGKTYHLEAEALEGRKIGEIVKGNEIKSELVGYELEITGVSDSTGFPGFKEIEGENRRRLLLTKGKGMRDSRNGIRIKKTIRGNTIAKDISQINLKVIKQGEKNLAEIFPEQNKPKEKKPITPEQQPIEQKQEGGK